jgi:hypothetical protein
MAVLSVAMAVFLARMTSASCETQWAVANQTCAATSTMLVGALTAFSVPCPSALPCGYEVGGGPSRASVRSSSRADHQYRRRWTAFFRHTIAATAHSLHRVEPIAGR